MEKNWNNRDTAVMLLAAGFALLWPWSYLAFHVQDRMILSEDFTQQFALLSWMHRSIFEGAGPLVSPPYFFPEQGILSVSEAPLLQGVLFGLLRLSGAAPVLSWNIAHGLGYALSAAALYACARGEGIGRGGSLLAALYCGAGIWVGLVGDGIHYRWAFGPPLAWLVLTRIENGASLRREAFWLSLVTFLQYDACATNALSTLFVVAARFLLTPGLWRRSTLAWTAAATFPAVATGLFWARLTSKYLTQLDHSPTLAGTAGQIYHRFDLANFLPLPSCILESLGSSWDQMPALAARSLSPPLALWIAAAAGTFLLHRHQGGAEAAAQPPATTTEALGTKILALLWALGAVAIGLASYRLQRIFPAFHAAAVGLFTAALWSGACGLYLYAQRRGTWIFSNAPAGSRYLALLLIGIWIGLGPLVFFGGVPLALGPLAVLDPLFPMLQRARVTANFLPVAALGLLLLAAAGAEGLAARLKLREQAVLAALAALSILALLPARLGLGDFPLRSVALPPEACPTCGREGLSTIAGPYRWLLENGGEGPLLELPAGYGNLNFPGEPPGGHDAAYMFYYALDGLARLNGTASFYSKDYLGLLKSVEEFPAPGSVAAIRRRGAKWVLVHGDRYEETRWKELEERLAQDPPGLQLEEIWGPLRLYRVE